MSTYVEATGHGFVADDCIVFSNLEGGQGIIEGEPYYVLATGLTADVFQFSDSIGGVAFAFDTDITSGDVAKWPEYSLAADGIQNPPETQPAPTGLSLSSTATIQADGVVQVRLNVGLTQPTNVAFRHSVVSITGPSGQPMQVIIPVGKTTGAIDGLLPGTTYTATAVAYDAFGQQSSASSPVSHTTAADTSAPSTPTGLAATAGILENILTWTASSATDLAYYEVAISTNGGSTFPNTYRTKSNVATFVGLSSTTTYTYKVRAVDASGNASAYSSNVSATPRLTDVVQNSTAEVIIDSTGLLIKNGKLTLQDENGQSVATASGFTGGWLDFIRLGLYNGRFLNGTVGTIANGRTSACPYWTFSAVTGTVTASFLSGGGVKFSTFSVLGAKKRMVSDAVPVRPGIDYAVPTTISAVWADGALIVAQATILWYQADGTTSAGTSTMQSISAGGSPAGSVTNLSWDVGAATAPASARYAKLQVDVSETLLHSATNTLTISTIGLVEGPPMNLLNVGTTRIRYFDSIDTTAFSSSQGRLVHDAGDVRSAATSLQTLTTTETDLTDCSVTLSVKAGDTIMVWGVVDFDNADAGAGTAVAVVRLNANGSTQTAEAHFNNNGSTTNGRGRMTAAAAWVVQIGVDDATYVLKLRGLVTAGTGTVRVNHPHSGFTYQVIR